MERNGVLQLSVRSKESTGLLFSLEFNPFFKNTLGKLVMDLVWKYYQQCG